MRSKRLAIGLSLLLISFLIGACALMPRDTASVSVEKTVSDAEQCVGQSVQFVISIVNDGGLPFSSIAVSDVIPAGLEYIETENILVPSYMATQATAPFTPGGTPSNPIWTFNGPLQPGDQIVILFNVLVASEGVHENCVMVQGMAQDMGHAGISVKSDDCAVVEGIICGSEHKMHYPQYPSEQGWDVRSSRHMSQPGTFWAADDWQCSETGLVENIRFWGSWRGDLVGEITGFHIEIFSNTPGSDTDPTSSAYSHPGALLWEAFITDYTEQEIQVAVPKGWYDPCCGVNAAAHNHSKYFQYDITDIQAAFRQEEGNIYWLSIWPETSGCGVWGWESSDDHWMAGACCHTDFPEILVSDWTEIYEPPLVVELLDLAFIIYGSEPESPCYCEEWAPIEVTAWPTTSPTWTGNCGESLTINPSGFQYGISITSSTHCTGCISPEILTYTWEVVEPDGNVFASGNGNTASFLPLHYSIYPHYEHYQVLIHTTCGGVECPPCILTVYEVE